MQGQWWTRPCSCFRLTSRTVLWTWWTRPAATSPDDNTVQGTPLVLFLSLEMTTPAFHVIPQCNRLALPFLCSVPISYVVSSWLFSSDEFGVCCCLLNYLNYSTSDPPWWLQIQLSISLRGVCTQSNYSTVKMRRPIPSDDISGSNWQPPACAHEFDKKGRL